MFMEEGLLPLTRFSACSAPFSAPVTVAHMLYSAHSYVKPKPKTV